MPVIHIGVSDELYEALDQIATKAGVTRPVLIVAMASTRVLGHHRRASQVARAVAEWKRTRDERD